MPTPEITGPDFFQMLKAADEGFTAAENLRKQADAEKLKANNRFNRVVWAIKDGRYGTGSRLRDYALVAYGIDSEEYLQRYLELNDRLMGKGGELALVALNRTPQLSTDSQLTDITLGLLDGEHLIIDQHNFKAPHIPTSVWTMPFSTTQRYQGLTARGSFDVTFLSNVVTDVILGNDEVNDWLVSQKSAELDQMQFK